MDIWITYCQKRANCHYCDKPVSVSEPMVKGKWWRKSNGEAAAWSHYFFWHPQCYLEEGLVNLSKTPFSSKHHGRPKLVLTPEDTVIRKHIVAEHAHYIYLIKEDIAAGLSVNDDKVTSKIVKLMLLAEEANKYGGAPKSWSKPLTAIIPELGEDYEDNSNDNY